MEVIFIKNNYIGLVILMGDMLSWPFMLVLFFNLTWTCGCISFVISLVDDLFNWTRQRWVPNHGSGAWLMIIEMALGRVQDGKGKKRLTR